MKTKIVESIKEWILIHVVLPIVGISIVFDEKENTLIISSRTRLGDVILDEVKRKGREHGEKGLRWV